VTITVNEELVRAHESKLPPVQRLMITIVRHCGPASGDQVVELTNALLQRMTAEEAIDWVVRESSTHH
jgi:hypothetical protein